VKKTWQVALITAAAAGLFVGLRSLPDVECGFLHYDPPVVNAEGIEFCGSDAPSFVDVGELAYPVVFDLVAAPGKPAAGEPVMVTLEIATKGGRAITPANLAITHTELMHVLVVDPTREDYHHVHPEPIGQSGVWQFSFTPRRGGAYRIFAEFVPSRTQQIVIAHGELAVAGEAIPSAAGPAGLPDGWTATLEAEPATPLVNTEARLRLTISRDDGQPAELEPVMAAYAHLVAFDPELRGFAHLHPKYTGRENDDSPQLEFVLNTHLPGDYRIWAQVKVDGRERFIPFKVTVEEPAKVAALR